MATLAEQASKLLDFDQKLDITLLDSIVGCMYSGAGEQVSYVFIEEDSGSFFQCQVLCYTFIVIPILVLIFILNT